MTYEERLNQNYIDYIEFDKMISYEGALEIVREMQDKIDELKDTIENYRHEINYLHDQNP